MNRELIPEIIGNPDGKVNYTKEERDAMRAIVLKAEKNRTPQQKQNNELLGIYAEIISYVDNHLHTIGTLGIGHFIKKILDIYNLPPKKLANYLNLNKSDFSAMMNGDRNIGYDIALKLAHIFGIKAELWLAIQNKNELLKLEQADKEEYKNYSLQGLMAA